MGKTRTARARPAAPTAAQQQQHQALLHALQSGLRSSGGEAEGAMSRVSLQPGAGRALSWGR